MARVRGESADGSELTNCDFAVHQAHTLTAGQVLRARGGDIVAMYFRSLGDALTTGFRGLRLMTGPTSYKRPPRKSVTASSRSLMTLPARR